MLHLRRILVHIVAKRFQPYSIESGFLSHHDILAVQCLKFVTHREESPRPTDSCPSSSLGSITGLECPHPRELGRGDSNARMKASALPGLRLRRAAPLRESRSGGGVWYPNAF